VTTGTAIFLMVAAFVYTSLLWAGLFGFAIFGDAPTATLLIGAAVIVASALYIVEREASLARARGKAAAQHQVLGSPEAEVIIVKREDMQ